MRILVIGLGSMGRRRIRNLRALGIGDISGYDPRADRRSAAVTEYGITAFPTWQEALGSAAEAWVVSTPPLTHSGYALQALERGAHVFTEADVPDPQANEVARMRDRTGLVAAASSTMRYYPGPVRVQALLEAGEIGRPLVFTYQTGQYLPDWHPWESYRDFYVSERQTGAAREIVPFELVWLTGVFGTLHEATGLKGTTGILDADIDDHYAIALRFGSGVAGTMLIDVLARPAVRAFRLIGTGGTLVWDQDEGCIRTRQSGQKEWTHHALKEGTPEAGYINPEEPYIAEMKAFLAAIGDGCPAHFRIEDEIDIHNILERIEKSAEARHP